MPGACGSGWRVGCTAGWGITAQPPPPVPPRSPRLTCACSSPILALPHALQPPQSCTLTERPLHLPVPPHPAWPPQAARGAPPRASASACTPPGRTSTSWRTTRYRRYRWDIGWAAGVAFRATLPITSAPCPPQPPPAASPPPAAPPTPPAAHQPGQRGPAAEEPGHQRPHQLRLHGPAAHG